MFNNKLKHEIKELERRLEIAMPENCRNGKHNIVPQHSMVISEGIQVTGTCTFYYECDKCGLRYEKGESHE